MARRIVFSVLGLTLFATFALTGCGGKQAEAIANADFAGTWVEDNSGSIKGGGVVQIDATARKVLRQLNINADGTFEMVLCDGTGKPLEPKVFSRGNWTTKQNSIDFERVESNLPEDKASWDPLGSIRLSLLARGHEEDALVIRNQDSTKTIYHRPQ